MADVIHNAEWSRKEENYQEYLRLLNDPDYYDVSFDEESGGVSGIHLRHRFDPTEGLYGIKKGEYEKIAVDILRRGGHAVILESEYAPNGIKTPDGTIDGIVMDIKAVEGMGKWAIKDKFHDATKKCVECVILYFHKEILFSKERMYDGWNKFKNDKDSIRYDMTIKRVICIIETKIVEWCIPQ